MSLKVIITNGTCGALGVRRPFETQVRLVDRENDVDIDLTESGVVDLPIQIEINEKGAFAILRLDLEGVDFGEMRG